MSKNPPTIPVEEFDAVYGEYVVRDIAPPKKQEPSSPKKPEANQPKASGPSNSPEGGPA